MSRISALALAMLSSVLATALPAAAKGDKPEASFKARAGKSLLVFECGDDKAIWLRVWHPVRGWRADKPSELRIGAATFGTEVDGATDSFLLSDVPSPGMGLTDALLSAAQARQRALFLQLIEDVLHGRPLSELVGVCYLIGR